MTQLMIELPEPVAEYVQSRVARGANRSVSEFVQQVLEIHRERESIERSVLDAVEANCGVAVTPDYWASMRQLVADRQQASSIEG